MAARRSGSEFVQSVSRAFAVIKSFDGDHPTLTISQVAQRTGLTRAAARRFLLTLQELGYIQSTNGDFRLTLRVLDLGSTVMSTTRLPDIAQPEMTEIVAKLRESCSVSVLDGSDIVYVARVPTKRIMTVSLTVGSRLPAYATSMGRVLLASLPPDGLDAFFRTTKLTRLTPRTICTERELRQVLAKVRENGWALVDNEVEEGVRSVAAPLRDRTGAVLAAINVSAHATRATVRDLKQVFLPVLLEGARRISTNLGAPPE
jgi:IclR family pca regulon transcriptional regulator